MRPTFLTVLCILTFIGSGFSIFNAVSSYQSADIAAGVASETIDEAFDQLESSGEEIPDFIEGILGDVSDEITPEKIKYNAIADGISALLTLMGAFLMWRLDKKGFWVYVAGIAVAIIAPTFIYDGFIGLANAGFQGFVGILFIILYAVNLKHMK